MPTHYGRNNVQKGRLKVEIDMKFALKTLAAALAIASIGSAYAAQASGTVGQAVVVKDPGTSGRSVELTLTSGTGGLYFSNGNGDPIGGPVLTGPPAGLVGALNVAKVVLTGVDGAAVNETTVTYGTRTKTTVRATSVINATVTKLTADIDGATAGRFTTVNATGGAQQFAAPIDGLLDGGSAVVNNLEIDLVNKRVYADILGNNGFDPVLEKKHVYLWDFTGITGPTTITPAALLKAADGDTSAVTALGFTITGQEAAQAGFGTKYSVSTDNLLTGLKVTQEGFDFFTFALGIPSSGTAFNTLKAVNDTAEGWGSLKSKINFTAREVLSVPEPSTYALMGLGLVGISLVARRRAK
jgi:hypothetical protein